MHVPGSKLTFSTIAFSTRVFPQEKPCQSSYDHEIESSAWHKFDLIAMQVSLKISQLSEGQSEDNVPSISTSSTYSMISSTAIQNK